MTSETRTPVSPRLGAALDEMKALIAGRYPEAIFDVGEGEDPDGVYLTATVDVEDMGEVVDVFLDRLVDLQVEEALPLFVVAVRPLARTVALLDRRPEPVAGALATL